MYNFLSRPNFCLRSVRKFFSPPKCRKLQALKVLFTIFWSEIYFSTSQLQSEMKFLQNNASNARTWGGSKDDQSLFWGQYRDLMDIFPRYFLCFLFQKVFLPLSTPIQDGISRIVNYLVDYNWSFSIQQRLVWAQIGGILLFLDKSPSGKVK